MVPYFVGQTASRNQQSVKPVRTEPHPNNPKMIKVDTTNPFNIFHDESRRNPIPPPDGGNVSAESLPSRIISIA